MGDLQSSPPLIQLSFPSLPLLTSSSSSFHSCLLHFHTPPSSSIPPSQAFERNAILENELDEKQRLAEMCQRLKDEVKGLGELLCG